MWERELHYQEFFSRFDYGHSSTKLGISEKGGQGVSRQRKYVDCGMRRVPEFIRNFVQLFSHKTATTMKMKSLVAYTFYAILLYVLVIKKQYLVVNGRTLG